MLEMVFLGKMYPASFPSIPKLSDLAVFIPEECHFNTCIAKINCMTQIKKKKQGYANLSLRQHMSLFELLSKMGSTLLVGLDIEIISFVLVVKH